MINTDIVIVDSGINTELYMDQTRISGLHIFDDGVSIKIDEKIQDDYGHGTAVTNIIEKHSKAKIFVLKIFETHESIDENLLVFAMKFIRDNINCSVINLSMGLKICENKQELESICNELRDNGIVIVSAFDNDGCISYPAAFDSVIGVGSSYRCKNAYQFEYIEGSPINILAKGGLQRIVWKDKSIVMGGCSFACAYITAYIFNLLHNQTFSFLQLHEKLRHSSVAVHSHKKHAKASDDYFKIKKAALFPMNKEMHALLCNLDSLNFSIVDLYDIKYSGRVGVSATNLIHSKNDSIHYTIKDINCLDFDSIDTLIVGHMDEINRMLNKDMRLQLIQSAIENKINVVSFDSLEYCQAQIIPRQSKVYYPEITKSDIPQNTCGKLYVIDKPIISIFGTSSQQGKFTLQLILRRLFKERGYSVGMIGTEPHSLLFGMDYVYPMGYNSTLRIDGHAGITLLNSMLNSICEKGAEIIIAASQANTIPTNIYNVTSFPVKQHTFLLGVQPDVAILCINPHDDIHYIINTIKYLEGTTNCKVISLVLFPMMITNDWRSVFGTKEKIDDKVTDKIKKEVEKQTSIPLFVLGDEIEMERLTDCLIDYFTNEEE